MADAAVCRIADRYATALYDVAEAGRALEPVAADMAFLKHCCEASPQLVRVLKSESVSDPDKLRALFALLARREAHTYTRNLLRVLAANQRLHRLVLVLDAFDRVAEARAGIRVACVTTAAPLAPAQQAALDATLAGRLGSKLRIVPQVDPDLLDGLTVQVGSHLYDASLRGKLQRLETQLSASAF